MPRPRRIPAPITTTIVRSLEPIDLDAWLYRYAQAILEAKGFTPTGAPTPQPPASTEAA
jgi:hypothetical protein